MYVLFWSEKTIKESHGLQNRVEQLESLVESYINRLNSIDLGYASQVKVHYDIIYIITSFLLVIIQPETCILLKIEYRTCQSQENNQSCTTYKVPLPFFD